MKHISLMIAVALLFSFAIPEANANVPKAAVVGAVFDSSGEAVPYAMIRFGIKTETRGLVIIETMTDATGKYIIERIPAGAGRVKVDGGERGAVSRSVMLEANMMNRVIIKLG